MLYVVFAAAAVGAGIGFGFGRASVKQADRKDAPPKKKSFPNLPRISKFKKNQ